MLYIGCSRERCRITLRRGQRSTQVAAQQNVPGDHRDRIANRRVAANCRNYLCVMFLPTPQFDDRFDDRKLEVMAPATVYNSESHSIETKKEKE